MTVKWSHEAKSKYLNTIDYLEDIWGEIVVKKFRKKVQKALNAIAKNPELGVYSNELKVRKFTLSQHNIIIYSI